MSRPPGSWLTTWVEQVHALLREPLPAFPARRLLWLLAETFDAIPAWHWVGPDGSMGVEMAHPPSGWPPSEQIEYWTEVPWWEHPITRWFLRTNSLAPQTLGRVPPSVGSRRYNDILRSQLGPFGIEQQMALPIVVGHRNSNFILSRTGHDFTNEQLILASQIQPLVMLLDRQVQAQGCLSAEQRTAVAALGLTGREVAVLRLLCDGLTSDAIGRRLACSPRTAQKHLEHIYRKLEVRDRLEAVLVAVAHNIWSPDPADRDSQTPVDDHVPPRRSSAEQDEKASERSLLVVRGRLRPYPDIGVN